MTRCDLLIAACLPVVFALGRSAFWFLCRAVEPRGKVVHLFCYMVLAIAAGLVAVAFLIAVIGLVFGDARCMLL